MLELVCEEGRLGDPTESLGCESGVSMDGYDALDGYERLVDDWEDMGGCWAWCGV